uniref:Ribosome recycling factor domain-containing protein n=1 Tax=Vannella robusta TaxID=1487602 RepID=A0A7S4HRY3_9EUKA|mmetsp:Transcript_14951/g.18922  ORF Transcript_14951/g.18922 Transcript_14951/m.18922 type:complete len:281 (+) Transcript_14951:58-900(+)
MHRSTSSLLSRFVVSPAFLSRSAFRPSNRYFTASAIQFHGNMLRTNSLSPRLEIFDCRGKKKKGGKSSEPSSALQDMAAEGVDMKYLEEKMNKTLEYLNNMLSGLRTERLSPSLIENVMIELPAKGEKAGEEKKKKKKKGGNLVPLRNIADISIFDHRTLVVHPHDEALQKSIIKGLNTAEGGFNPQPHEGQGIKVPIPKMTLEFREQLEKTINKYCEECKESLRRVRREGMDQVKKIKTMVSKDEAFRQEKKIQELLDRMTKAVNDRTAQKIVEIKDIQ